MTQNAASLNLQGVAKLTKSQAMYDQLLADLENEISVINVAKVREALRLIEESELGGTDSAARGGAATALLIERLPLDAKARLADDFLFRKGCEGIAADLKRETVLGVREFFDAYYSQEYAKRIVENCWELEIHRLQAAVSAHKKINQRKARRRIKESVARALLLRAAIEQGNKNGNWLAACDKSIEIFKLSGRACFTGQEIIFETSCETITTNLILGGNPQASLLGSYK